MPYVCLALHSDLEIYYKSLDYNDIQHLGL